jgi:hypothetical protein
MTAVQNSAAKEWLTKHINWRRTTEPPTVKDCLPPFDNYLAILWVPGIVDNFPFDKIVEPPITIEQINTNVAIRRQFNLFLNEESDQPYRETTFQELAKHFNKPYNRQIIYSLRWETKGIKTLFRQTRQRLEKLINELSGNETLYAYIEDHWRWFNVYNVMPAISDSVYQTTADEYLEFMDKSFYDANIYLYPENKSWCLLNLEDLSYNILGYNNAVADKINQLNLTDIFIMKSSDGVYASNV